MSQINVYRNKRNEIEILEPTIREFSLEFGLSDEAQCGAMTFSKKREQRCLTNRVRPVRRELCSVREKGFKLAGSLLASFPFEGRVSQCKALSPLFIFDLICVIFTLGVHFAISDAFQNKRRSGTELPQGPENFNAKMENKPE